MQHASGFNHLCAACFVLLQKSEERITKKAHQAESLQKKIRAEKQFNRQMELNGEARKIKREIAELRKEMERLKGE